MEWRDDILADIPDSPKDNEPESLRAEILEELGDHLQCAMNRELLNHGDPQTARQNVIERFGNVSQVARQMWFEAMKGQIMSQRLMVGMTAVMFLCCMAMGAFAFFSYSKVRQLQEVATVARLQAMEEQERATRSMQLAQEQSRLASEQLQKQLATVAEATPKSMDWNPFKVKLVDETGVPAPSGFKVRLSGKPHSGNDDETLREVSDENGLVEFGAVRPGSFTLYVTSPWGESLNFPRSQSGQRISPGSDTVREIVCPSQPPSKGSATFEMEWHKEFMDGRQPQVAALVFVSSTARTVAGNEWLPGTSKSLTFFPDGRVFQANVNENLNRTISKTENRFTLLRPASLIEIGAEITGKMTEFSGSEITVTPAVLFSSNSATFDEPGNRSPIQLVAGGADAVASKFRQYVRGESPNPSSLRFYEGFEEIELQRISLDVAGIDVALSIPDDVWEDAKHLALILGQDFAITSNTTKRSLISKFYTKDTNHDQKLTRNEYGTVDTETSVRSWSPSDDEFPLTPKSMIASYEKWYAQRRKKAAASRNGARNGR